MPQGDKRKYTDKQKRKAEHIAEGFQSRGVSSKEAKRRAWATVNAIHGGGEKPGGSGHGKPERKAPMRKGAAKAAATRRRTRKATSRATSQATRKRTTKRATGRRRTR